MKEELITDLENSRKNLLAVISKMTDDFVIDKWTKKELLAHFCGWEEEAIRCIPQILKGKKPISFKMSVNRFNEESVKLSIGKNLEELLKELKSLRSEFNERLKVLTQDQISNFYGTTLGKKKINIIWIVKELIDHDQNHTKDLQKRLLS